MNKTAFLFGNRSGGAAALSGIHTACCIDENLKLWCIVLAVLRIIYWKCD